MGAGSLQTTGNTSAAAAAGIISGEIQERVGLQIMYLVVAATQKEMAAFEAVAGTERLPLDQLVSGVGPVETAFSLGQHLERHHRKIRSVVNFGIGGAVR
ncbi:MAG: hypothetical protein P8X39_03825 [Desulfofustis sp.]